MTRVAYAVGLKPHEMWQVTPRHLAEMAEALAMLHGVKPETKPPDDIKAALAAITRKSDG